MTEYRHFFYPSNYGTDKRIWPCTEKQIEIYSAQEGVEFFNPTLSVVLPLLEDLPSVLPFPYMSLGGCFSPSLTTNCLDKHIYIFGKSGPEI